ncbi:MAG: alpha/beta fold hydrolase [Chloroflexi bacterium]|nr:alpha/beta fold hydrolase [Chloroflexota bacterium]
MNQFRNFVIRVSIAYIVLGLIALLPGIRYGDGLFALWAIAIVFVIFSAVLRPLFLAIALPFIIATAGLFIFVIDGLLLLFTALVTSLDVAGFGWALLAAFGMSITNIYMENAFKRLGWLDLEEDDEFTRIESPSTLLRILLMVVLLAGITFSGAMAAQVVLALSIVTPSLQLIGAGGVVTFFALTLGIAWLVASGLSMQRRAIFSGLVAASCTVIVIVASRVILFQPLNVEPLSLERPPNVQFWELPTGSRIAYTEFLGPADNLNPPVIVLHGGPGFPILEADRDFYMQFAADGFDVYLYDQVGTGFSEKLDTLSAYGVERNIADLDAIRAEIGADDLILIGQGAGSELAARYTAEFPERVSKIVFHSPTALWEDETFFVDYTRTASPIGPLTVFEPRALLAIGLTTFGPNAAQRLVTQETMIAYAQQRYAPGVFVCADDAEQAPSLQNAAINYYVELRVELTTSDLLDGTDPRPQLANNLTPVIILTSECDYVAWEVIEQYRQTFLNNRVFYFQDAGHLIHLTQGDAMAGVIEAFLLEEDYPMVPYESSSSPRPIIPLADQ